MAAFMGNMFSIFNMHVYVHMHVCTRAGGGTLYTSTTPSTHHPLPMGTLPISKNAISLKLMKKNSILFKDLKFVETPLPTGGCMVWWWMGGRWLGGWMGLWLGSCQITNN